MRLRLLSLNVLIIKGVFRTRGLLGSHRCVADQIKLTENYDDCQEIQIKKKKLN